MKRIVTIVLCCTIGLTSSSQYTWKLEKDKDGIKVYTSSKAGTSFKSVKVECTLQGTYSKLLRILSEVKNFDDWIYHTKRASLLKKNSQYDFIYYTEISLPWPVSNRDVVIHMNIKTDSLPKFLSIRGKNELDMLPEFPSLVRVPHYVSTWHVTMPSSNKVQISYILELDPGGSIPASIANSFVDRGPFETFKKLAEKLKQ